LAPILQHGSGPSPALLAKILGVNTQLFLCDILFIFRFLHYDLISLTDAISIMSHAVAASMLACGVGNLGSSLTYIIPLFFCNMYIMALKAMMLFSFVTFSIFLFYLCSFIFQNERSATGFSTRMTENTPIFDSSEE
jgi:hypothetical protein